MPTFLAHVDLPEEAFTDAEHPSALEQMSRLTDLQRVLAMAVLLPMLKELQSLVQVHILSVSVSAVCCKTSSTSFSVD